MSSSSLRALLPLPLHTFIRCPSPANVVGWSPTQRFQRTGLSQCGSQEVVVISSSRNFGSRFAFTRLLSSSSSSTSEAAAASKDVLKLKDMQQASWSKFYALEANQLNWMRNGLSLSAVGFALVQFREKNSNVPPVGGLLLALGGFATMVTGGVVHVAGAYQQRAALRLSPLGWTHVIAHATLPPMLWAVAMQCLVDKHPKFICQLLHANRHNLPNMLKDGLEHLPHKPDATN